jgi:flagellar hook protein FlgE
VDLAGQLTDLITAQRAYEANAKVITTSDQILQDLNNLGR